MFQLNFVIDKKVHTPSQSPFSFIHFFLFLKKSVIYHCGNTKKSKVAKSIIHSTPIFTVSRASINRLQSMCRADFDEGGGSFQ